MKEKYQKIFKQPNTRRRELRLCSRYNYFGPEGAWKDKNHHILTLADMDFEVPQPLKDVVIKRAQEGNWVYCFGEEQLPRSINKWMKERHNLEVKPDQLVWGNGVLVMMQNILQHVTKPGEKIVVQTPVYTPFYQLPTHLDRGLVESPLVRDENGKYQMDFDSLEKSFKQKDVKAMFLCNPHNPVGRVWSKEELQKVHDLAKANDVFIISDEIWMDIVFKGNKYTPFMTLSKWAEQNSICCTSATKTFNLGGIQHGYAIIKNKELWAQMYGYMEDTFHVGSHNHFNIFILEEAYNNKECIDWLEAVNELVESNYNIVLTLEEVGIKVSKQDGLFLSWLDFAPTGLTKEEDVKKLMTDCNFTASTGSSYGADCVSFMRLNIAQPEVVVKDVVERIKNYIKGNK